MRPAILRPPDGDGGEGDSTGRPRSQRPGGLAWRALVIEARYSEPLEELMDTKRWFGASNHEVNVVLLPKVDRSQREILLGKWVKVQAGGRQEATIQADAQLGPDCDPAVAITQRPGKIRSALMLRRTLSRRVLCD